MPVDDAEEEDWSDAEDDDLDAAVPCPECGAAIYADLDHCPQCGYWLTDADRRGLDGGTGPFSSRRRRIVAVALLAIFVLALLAGLWGRF